MSKKLMVTISLALCLGCKSGGSGLPLMSPAPAASEPLTAAPSQQDQAPAFSFRRAMQLVGLSGLGSGTAPAQNTGLLPPEFVQLSATVNSIVTRAAELNARDPAHVTVQKAQAIMESLRPWDAAMTAAKSVGLVNDTTAQPLEMLVAQLRANTQQLLQFGSQPEIIAAIQQLAGQLKSSYSGVAQLFSHGSMHRARVGSGTR